jgi:Tol biopolymer transport system component
MNRAQVQRTVRVSSALGLLVAALSLSACRPAAKRAQSSPQAVGSAQVARSGCVELAAEYAEKDGRSDSKAAHWLAVTDAQLPRAWLAYEEGGQVRAVTTDGRKRIALGPGIQPRWLPNGRELVFISAAEGALPRLFVTSLDCTGLRSISGPLLEDFDTSAGADAYAGLSVESAISPDGSSVAFTRNAADGRTALFVADVSTGNERQLVEDVDSVEPAWAPDSRALVTDRFVDGGSKLLYVDVVTGQTRELAQVNNPSFLFLQDGRLLFQSARGDSRTIEDRESYLMLLSPLRADISYPVPGSQLAPGRYFGMQASGDGKRFAAGWSLRTGNGPAALTEHGLAVFDVPEPQLKDVGRKVFGASPAEEIITFVTPKTLNLALGAGDALDVDDPTWAPDSRHLAFTLAACDVRLADCARQIVAVNTQATRVQVVFLARGQAPQWQPMPHLHPAHQGQPARAAAP